MRKTAERWLTRAGIVAAVGCALGLGVACSTSDDDAGHKGLPPGTTSASGTGAGSGSCTDGDQQECHVTVGEHDGVLTCLDGMRTCSSGAWGPCNGSFTKKAMPGGGSEGDGNAKPLSLSDAGPCATNPCDPTCQVFDEQPDGGVGSEGGVTSNYQSGDVASIPGMFVGNGINEPCGTASDCQFDHVCNLPESGTCAHSKCVAGSLLDGACDPCVGAICAGDPTCCEAPPGTCSHDVCVTGQALEDGCDPCVTQICMTEPTCCEVPYDTAMACAHEACLPGVDLASGCDPCVGSICATNPACCTATAGGGCAHLVCTLGAPLVSGCDPCVTDICAQNEGCCAPPTSTFLPACALAGHDPCTQGALLPDTCDPCVTTICADAAYAYCCTANWDLACVDAVNAFCAPKSCDTTWSQNCADLVATTPSCGGQTCTPSWSAACVAEVAATCGESCAAGAWDPTCVGDVSTICGQTCGSWGSTCVDQVDTVCGALCEPPGDPDVACEHDPCFRGPALDSACSPCVTQICMADAACCSSQWSAACVAAVATVCGGTCATGDCAPWPAGDTDPACSGVDLTAGVPCTGFVPICNRGQSTVPAGVVVYAYDGGSTDFPGCNPTPMTELSQCTVPAAILPGQCVNISDADCTMPLVAPMTVMVNPPASAGNAAYVAECHCENDWSDYHNGGCTMTGVTTFATMTYKQEYTATCPTGTAVQWGFLAYDTTTPGDSNIVIQVHTADTSANLGVPFKDVATAEATPDTQVCLMSGPAPCPQDLFTILGKPDANLAVLELVFTMNPTSTGLAGPTLNSWELTYSCPDSE